MNIKVVVISSVIFILLSNSSSAQKKTKPDTTIVLPTDIYDNFKSGSNNTKSYVSIKSEKTGKIIYEDSVINRDCAACYDKITFKADSLYKLTEYSDAVKMYEIAFILNKDKGKVKHRYNAACCWTQLNKKDLAFRQLQKIVTIGKYYNTYQISSDVCFTPLHTDPKWNLLLTEVEKNKINTQKKLSNIPVIEQ
jgi:tetratricopeptide (TPR) repeat protein